MGIPVNKVVAVASRKGTCAIISTRILSPHSFSSYATLHFNDVIIGSRSLE